MHATFRISVSKLPNFQILTNLAFFTYEAKQIETKDFFPQETKTSILREREMQQIN